jgi:pimeloyl-ACP methyl ester carboxylesterase
MDDSNKFGKSNPSSIHITRWGTQGPTVVMVHGSAQGSNVGGNQHFSPQQKLAEKGYQIIVPDRPGHGRSPSPGRPDDAVADAEWVVELLGDEAHLVGHSFGGVVALAAAARRPEALQSLTLIEPALLGLAANNPVVLAFLQSQVALFTSKRPPQEIAIEFMKMVRIPENLRSGPHNPEELTRIGEAIVQLRIPQPPILKDWVETVAKAKIPVLIVTGGWNPAFDICAGTVAKMINGRHVIVESDHHLPQRANPDEFNDLLNNFMKEAGQAL